MTVWITISWPSSFNNVELTIEVMIEVRMSWHRYLSLHHESLRQLFRWVYQKDGVDLITAHDLNMIYVEGFKAMKGWIDRVGVNAQRGLAFVLFVLCGCCWNKWFANTAFSLQCDMYFCHYKSSSKLGFGLKVKPRISVFALLLAFSSSLVFSCIDGFFSAAIKRAT